MAKDYENEFDHTELDDLSDLDAPDLQDVELPEQGEASDQELRQAIEEALAEDERPVRKVGKVVDDPLAESESTEDIYSGTYRRDTSDRGVYTGGTRKERVMSDTLGTEEARTARRKKRARRRRNRRILTALIVLALLAGLGFAAFANRSRIPVLKDLFGGAKQETTAEPETTVPETTAAPETTPAPTTAAPETTSAVPAIQTSLPADSVPEVKALVNNYYNAILEGNAKQLASILDPAVELDEEGIAAFESQSAGIESYDDITTYALTGKNAGEYAVYISYGLKFPGVDTPAPGMVPAYARPDSEGNLRLLRYEDFDDDIKATVAEVNKQEDVKDLVNQVNNAYAAALASDPALKAYIDNLSGVTETESAAEGETPAEGETQAEGESQAETTAAADGSFTTVDDIQYTTTRVNLRSEPSTSSDDTIIRAVDEGTWVHVIGDSAEWVRCNLRDGTVGYISKQFLTENAPD